MAEYCALRVKLNKPHLEPLLEIRWLCLRRDLKRDTGNLSAREEYGNCIKLQALKENSLLQSTGEVDWFDQLCRMHTSWPSMFVEIAKN